MTHGTSAIVMPEALERGWLAMIGVRRAVVAVWLAVSLTALGCATGAPPGNLTGQSTAVLEQWCVDLVNLERTDRGLSALVRAADVQTVARAHSQDMALRNYFSHDTPEGVTAAERAQNAGISYTWYGENIAWVSDWAGRSEQQVAREIVDGWMNSEGHRRNILSPEYQEHGLGVAQSSNGIYVTQNFIAR
jgi:uncharacterized protein YkwD